MKDRLPGKKAAYYLGVKNGTLAQWRMSGKSPAYIKVGGKVFYYKSTLDEWLQSRIRNNTKDGGIS